MTDKLRELTDHIITCIDMDDHKSTMRAISLFTVLFEDFIQQNKDYIFDREMASLNRCLAQMMHCLENNDLQSLKKIIDSNFKVFLDDWDFENNSFIN